MMTDDDPSPGTASAHRRCLVLAALLLVIPSAARAEDWKYDVVVLQPGVLPEGPRSLKGLLVDYKEGANEIVLRVIHREDGEPTRIEPSTYSYKRSQLVSVEPLDPDDRAVLERRVRALTATPKELRKRIRELKPEAVEIDFGKAGKAKGFCYRDEGEHFVLKANVKEEVFLLSVERLALIYNAYAHTLAPRITSARPTLILLAGTQADYQALLKERGLSFFNPAFFDPTRNQVVCGSDLTTLGTQFEQARKDNDRVRAELEKREAELKKVYGTKVPPAVMRPLNEARQQLAATEAANTKRFDEATHVLFRRLYHESFHAYLASFVYSGERAEMPRWLNEGLAQLFETALIEGDEVRVARPDPDRLKRARAGELVPLGDLLRSGPRQFLVAHASDKETSDRYYLTSWALAHYLASDGRILNTGKLDDYCRSTRLQADPLEAFAALVGLKKEELPQYEERFRAYLQNLRPAGSRP
jgi:hypothetical protein